MPDVATVPIRPTLPKVLRFAALDLEQLVTSFVAVDVSRHHATGGTVRRVGSGREEIRRLQAHCSSDVKKGAAALTADKCSPIISLLHGEALVLVVVSRAACLKLISAFPNACQQTENAIEPLSSADASTVECERQG